jgi:hypothetical protein
MSVTAMRSSTLKPEVPELLSRARAIAEIVRARVQETEVNRRIADDVIERMREAELFRILQPEAYGGFEYGFDIFAELVATIGRGCGSSAWVYGLGAVHQWFTACFPKQAQDEFWADPGAIAAGSYAPVGKTVAVDGGYRTSGVWSFASGCDNAQWYFLSTMVPAVGGSESAPRGCPDRRQLAHYGARWDRQQEHRGGRPLRPRTPRVGDCGPCRGDQPGNAHQHQPALSPVVSCSRAGNADLAGARHGGGRPRRFRRYGEGAHDTRSCRRR